ncbi:LysM peptidoglycan-binding domain-containing protein [Neptunicoccus cionae]|uniref:LysM domain-containing protein n=1 Tax=Neptunicoccus cionae TaxID=2035344 RepID=A0A916QYI8_9RHOB|nr:LysM peptidoglycan-binding domain-containing protein [Amylibacter cionae]GGA21663.1 hypothetical protein GCM10011498_22980 [Amylibacter cionae]
MSKLPSISVPIQIAIAGLTLAVIMALIVFLREPSPLELVPVMEETTTPEPAQQGAAVQEPTVPSVETAQRDTAVSDAPREQEPASNEADVNPVEDFALIGDETLEPADPADPVEAEETVAITAAVTKTAPLDTEVKADVVPVEENAAAPIKPEAQAESVVTTQTAAVTEPTAAVDVSAEDNSTSADTPETTDAAEGADAPATVSADEPLGPLDETDTAALEVASETGSQVEVAEPAVEPSPEVASNQAPPASASDVQLGTAQPEPTAAEPRFDLVRVDNSGATVIAGQAAPGAQVQVTLGNAPLETVRADQSGSFVAIVQLPAGDTPQTMGLEELRDGTVVSTSPQTVLVVPPQPDMPETSPTIVVADTQGAAVIQPGQPVVPEELSDDPLSLDTISYDQGGAVVLSGRGSGDQFVRVYVDNQPIQTEPVLQDGNWRVVLPAVDQGVHTLRVDQISKGGDVLSRVESPFKREAPAELAAAARNAPDQSTVIVQPGHTLWALAESRYGDGVKYVQIFSANRDRIKNADLIYPGQVFDLPEGADPK